MNCRLQDEDPPRSPWWQTLCIVETVNCPFCSVPESRIIHGHPLAVVVRDAYPVAPGHTLVIPRRHVGSFFGLHRSEQAAMLSLLQQAGYTTGVNDGPAAGQTVPHVHMHLIPRHHGDVEDPRGGIRWVLPSKARYWT
jgi:diadenosine tetraphosphate (Ap4A) HIT family hydrolase